MINFIRNLHIDRLSFWIGFISGSLIWMVLRRLGPTLLEFWHWLKERINAARTDLLAGTEVRHLNDTINRVQAQHLASPMFSLEEIFIEPVFLAPPAPVEPNVTPPRQDMTEYVLPFLPDWPRLGRIYGAPTFQLSEALQADSHLTILGDSGAGKSVTLAYIAVQLARHAIDSGPYTNRVPFYLHVVDLELESDQPESALAPIQSAISAHASTLTLPRLANFITNTFETGRAALLLDGFDEISPLNQEEIVRFLRSLLDEYPNTKVIVTADQHLTGLPGLQFYPLVLAPWDIFQRATFIQRWSARWMKYIAQPAPSGEDERLNPVLLNGWLLVDPGPYTPLELTLKVWGAYAQDIPGPTARDAIEAYLDRMSAGIPKGRKALEQLAAQMLFTMRSSVSRKEAEQFIKTYGIPQPVFEPVFESVNETPNEADQASLEEEIPDGDAPDQEPASPEVIAASRVFPGLIENGLLISRSGGQLSIVHPVIAAYLATKAIDETGEGESLASQPDWIGKNLAFRFMAVDKDLGSWLAPTADQPATDLLMNNLLTASRCLVYAPANAAWTTTIIRKLAGVLQNEAFPISLRARVVAALVETKLPGIDVLFRQFLKGKDPVLIQLAALGVGAIKDSKAIPELSKVLGESHPNMRRAACLALVSLGNDEALEVVATALLHADEELRIIAAEALANHPEEGYAILKDGSKIEDVLVRRAVVAGLQRVAQPWAEEILARLRLEDSQWVVQNAATQALEELAQPESRLPKPLPELSETPWLIAFAGERGMGIAPGKPATDLVYLALKEGSEEQKLAALYYLGRCGDEGAILPLYECYFTSIGEVKDAAYQALWLLDAGGLPLPPPMEFGYK